MLDLDRILAAAEAAQEIGDGAAWYGAEGPPTVLLTKDERAYITTMSPPTTIALVGELKAYREAVKKIRNELRGRRDDNLNYLVLANIDLIVNHNAALNPEDGGREYAAPPPS